MLNSIKCNIKKINANVLLKYTNAPINPHTKPLHNRNEYLGSNNTPK